MAAKGAQNLAKKNRKQGPKIGKTAGHGCVAQVCSMAGRGGAKHWPVIPGLGEKESTRADCTAVRQRRLSVKKACLAPVWDAVAAAAGGRVHRLPAAARTWAAKARRARCSMQRSTRVGRAKPTAATAAAPWSTHAVGQAEEYTCMGESRGWGA